MGRNPLARPGTALFGVARRLCLAVLPLVGILHSSASLARVQNVRGSEEGSFRLVWEAAFRCSTSTAYVYVPEPAQAARAEGAAWSLERGLTLSYSLDQRSWQRLAGRVEMPATSPGYWKEPLGDGQYLRYDIPVQSNWPFSLYLRYEVDQYVRTVVDSVAPIALPESLPKFARRYLQATRYCDADSPIIDSVAQALRRGAPTGCDSLTWMVEQVLAQLSTFPTKLEIQTERASDVWARKGGLLGPVAEEEQVVFATDCKGLANSACAVLRRLGIPARVVLTAATSRSKYCVRDGMDRSLHALLEYFNGSEWVLCEPDCSIHFACSQVRLASDHIDKLAVIYPFPGGSIQMMRPYWFSVGLKFSGLDGQWKPPIDARDDLNRGLWLSRQAVHPCRR